jgi:hypothetical protein
LPPSPGSTPRPAPRVTVCAHAIRSRSPWAGDRPSPSACGLTVMALATEGTSSASASSLCCSSCPRTPYGVLLLGNFGPVQPVSANAAEAFKSADRRSVWSPCTGGFGRRRYARCSFTRKREVQRPTTAERRIHVAALALVLGRTYAQCMGGEGVMPGMCSVVDRDWPGLHVASADCTTTASAPRAAPQDARAFGWQSGSVKRRRTPRRHARRRGRRWPA